MPGVLIPAVKCLYKTGYTGRVRYLFETEYRVGGPSVEYEFEYSAIKQSPGILGTSPASATRSL